MKFGVTVSSPHVSPEVLDWIHRAMAERVKLALGQTGFQEVVAVQEAAAAELARLGEAAHAPAEAREPGAFAVAVMHGFGLDANYYDASDMAYLISEGLCALGVRVAEAVSGHEQDTAARWEHEVVPQLDQLKQEAARVFAGEPA
jgi:hypothetical protein